MNINQNNFISHKKYLFIALLLIVLRFFCNIRFSFVVPYLSTLDDMQTLDKIANYWMFALLAGLICGAYIIGKIAEKRGVFLLANIVSVGVVLSCLLMYFLGAKDKYISNFSLLLIIRFLNAFFQPAALIVPTIVFMKAFENKQNIKICAYFIVAALLGMQISYYTATYICEGHLLLWCKIFLIISFAILIFHLISNSSLKKVNKIFFSKGIKRKDHIAIIFAFLIGSVFITSIRYHYFFVDTYLTDFLVTVDNPSLGYVFFYGALNLSLLIAANTFKQENIFKLLSWSLIGILLIAITPVILTLDSLYTNITFQVIFAIFVAVFLSSSLAAIYTLFQDNSPIFNCVMWFASGYAIGNFASDWLVELYGFFSHTNFLPMIPLIISGFGTLAILTASNIKTQFVCGREV